MKQVQWYHARDNKQFGPVSTAELKQLAQGGSLRPDDLVWREGLKSWTAAREVKGLFEDNGPAAEAKPAAESKPSSEAAPPAETRPAVEAKPQVEAKAPIEAKPAVELKAAPATVIASPPPASNGSGSVAVAPSAKVAAPAPAHHPMDVLLEFARRQFAPQFVTSASRLFVTCGHYALLGATLGAVAFYTLLGVQLKDWQRPLAGLGVMLLLAVLQYAAWRFCEAIEEVRRQGQVRIASTALPDCLALLNLALGTAALVWLTLLAIGAEGYSYWSIAVGLAIFIVCQHAATVALNPEWLRVTTSATLRSSEESLGLLGFLARMMLASTPVAFGVGSMYGATRLLFACYVLFRSGAAIAEAEAGLAILLILASAALPLAAYLAFAACNLLIDLARALLSLPVRDPAWADRPGSRQETEASESSASG